MSNINIFQPNKYPLKNGMRLIEASAGTGKTFSLAHLVLRLLTEKEYKINEILVVSFTEATASEIKAKIIEVKDDKIKFSVRALEKDPLDWFKQNRKKVGDIITTRIHEVLKTGVKVAVDKDKKLIVTIRKTDLAKDAADQRPEVFSKDNALDAKIVELDLDSRKVKLSVKAAQIDEEKSLIAKFGEGATKSGATLKGIFEKAIGKKKEEK